eukprot:TRINITY_DN10302_c0_g1_i4.p1 TRINITY_DN10302_c0_g1~~TRINITY_DN10302_c0_g1_i4.p1  ORF type:complete len:239 (+),score=42.98 TRINITY_DN10302_c0_g1_i4:185-901(+)
MRASSRLLLVCALLLGILSSSTIITGVQGQGGSNGIDMSDEECQAYTASMWKCLRTTGSHTFAIIQAFRGGNQINQATARCVADAWAANFTSVDIYVWMCPNCEGNVPASNAMTNLIKYLHSHNVTFGRVWMDIELCDNDPNCWSSLPTNIQFIQEAVTTFQKNNIKVGIYSTPWEWERVFGASFSGFKDLPLWYANPNGQETFSDFAPFGGWTKPLIKQYYWYGNDCGATYDADWHP